MHINWLKIQICVLRFMIRSHARNGNECQTPHHRHSAANIEIPSKSKTGLKFMKLGNFFVPFGAGLGICLSQTRASHNKRDGFGRERATFGDETISVASYFFQKNSSVSIELQECCV